eukprot:GHVP01027088.1.p1 GENE.GHVP01027088.1~~GHVP01027088.1.p1  ORF type:complete len:873 (+),score=125.59 GHVP01027088.1:21-2639(+)
MLLEASVDKLDIEPAASEVSESCESQERDVDGISEEERPIAGDQPDTQEQKKSETQNHKLEELKSFYPDNNSRDLPPLRKDLKKSMEFESEINQEENVPQPKPEPPANFVGENKEVLAAFDELVMSSQDVHMNPTRPNHPVHPPPQTRRGSRQRRHPDSYSHHYPHPHQPSTRDGDVYEPYPYNHPAMEHYASHRPPMMYPYDRRLENFPPHMSQYVPMDSYQQNSHYDRPMPRQSHSKTSEKFKISSSASQPELYKHDEDSYQRQALHQKIYQDLYYSLPKGPEPYHLHPPASSALSGDRRLLQHHQDEYKTVSQENLPYPQTRHEDYSHFQSRLEQQPQPQQRREDFGSHEDFPEPQLPYEQQPQPQQQHKDSPQAQPRHEEYPQPQPRVEQQPQPKQRHEDYPQPQHCHDGYPQPRQEQQSQPQPLSKEYHHPQPRHEDYIQAQTRHKDYFVAQPHHEQKPQTLPRYEDCIQPQQLHENFPLPQQGHEEYLQPQQRHEDFLQPQFSCSQQHEEYQQATITDGPPPTFHAEFNVRRNTREDARSENIELAAKRNNHQSEHIYAQGIQTTLSNNAINTDIGVSDIEVKPDVVSTQEPIIVDSEPKSNCEAFFSNSGGKTLRLPGLPPPHLADNNQFLISNTATIKQEQETESQGKYHLLRPVAPKISPVFPVQSTKLVETPEVETYVPPIRSFISSSDRASRYVSQTAQHSMENVSGEVVSRTVSYDWKDDPRFTDFETSFTAAETSVKYPPVYRTGPRMSSTKTTSTTTYPTVTTSRTEYVSGGKYYEMPRGTDSTDKQFFSQGRIESSTNQSRGQSKGDDLWEGIDVSEAVVMKEGPALEERVTLKAPMYTTWQAMAEAARQKVDRSKH